MIDAYRFGEMVVAGVRYHSDLILYPDRINADWWRQTGHELCIADIEEILAAQPECLVVGTGKPGYMRVLSETGDYLQQHGIQLIVEPTEQAYQKYNALSATQRVVGAFHLTC